MKKFNNNKKLNKLVLFLLQKMKRQKGSGIRRPFVNKRNCLMLGKGKRTIKGSGVTRPFVNKRDRLMLGNGKRKITRKQKGGFWGPLLATLAPTAIDLVKKVIK